MVGSIGDDKSFVEASKSNSNDWSQMINANVIYKLGSCHLAKFLQNCFNGAKHIFWLLSLAAGGSCPHHNSPWISHT